MASFTSTLTAALDDIAPARRVTSRDAMQRLGAVRHTCYARTFGKCNPNIEPLPLFHPALWQRLNDPLP